MFREYLPARSEARRLLIGVLLASIGRGLTLPFLFIYLTDVRGMRDATAGVAIGWYGAVLLILSPAGGALMDRIGVRPVLVPAYLVQACGTAVLAFATSPVAVFGALTVMGAGLAPAWPGATTLLASLTGEQERQRVFGLQFALLNLGIGIGGLTAGAVVDTARPVTFQAIYLIEAVTFLVPAGIVLSMPGVGRAPAVREESHGPRGGYLTVLRDRAFRRLMIFGLVLTTCGYAQIEVGFAAFSTRVADVSPRIVAWALAANTVTIVAAQLLVVKRLEGRSRSRTLIVVGAVFAAAWLILGLGGLAGDGAPVLAALCVILCAAVFACGETFLQPVLPAITNALATDELRGRYNAALSMLFGISSVIGPVTAGPLIGAGQGGAWVAMVVGGCLVSSLLAVTMHRLLSPAQDGRNDPRKAGPAVLI